MDGNNDDDNGNYNVNNNADPAARIEQSQAGLQRIKRALSQAERYEEGWEQQLSDSIWQFLTTFSDESISQGNRHLLASDLIVAVLEEHEVRREANPNLYPVRLFLTDAFKDFFDDRDLSADMLPFFTAKLVDAQGATDENVQGQGQRQMSGAVEVTDLTNHQTIKKFYHRCNTKFETFDPNYTEVQHVFRDEDVNKKANRAYFSWLFETSLYDVIIHETREVSEAVQMYRLSGLIFEILGGTSMFKMMVPRNSNPDMKVINRDTKKTIFIGESKSNEKLPPTPPSAQLSKQLLDHGFATALATVTYEGEGEQDLNQSARNLRERLHVPLDNLQQKKIPIDRLSERARHILQIENNNDAELNGSYDGVIEAFEAGQINDENALHLWKATMQACVKSIELKMKYTMVLSNRVVWFIHLQDGNRNSDVNQEEGCGMIGISKGLAVGSKSFIQDFIQYAAMVERIDDMENNEKDCPHLKDEHDACGSKKAETVDSHSSSTMTDQEQMRWQRALWSPARNAGTTKKVLRRGTSPTTAPTAGNFKGDTEYMAVIDMESVDFIGKR